MSLAVRSAARVKPEIRLSQECEEFRKALNRGQRKIFQDQLKNGPPTHQDVAAFAMEIDQQIHWKVKRCLGSRLEGFLSNIQSFVSIGDVLVGGSQNMPAIAVWSVVRTTIQVRTIGLDWMQWTDVPQMLFNVTSFLEKLSDILLEVFRACAVQQTLVQMYGSSRHLQLASCEYLINVVKLFTKALNFLNNPKKLGNILSAAMKGFDGEFGSLAKELRICAKQLKQEIDLASKSIQLEIKQSTGELLENQNTRERQRREKARLRFLDLISTYDCRSAWRFAWDKGAPTWLFRQRDYKDWKSSSSSCMLWLTGIIGSGKSVVAANVVQDLRRSSSTAKIGYFFVRPDEVTSLEYSTIIASISRQLLQAAEHPTDETIRATTDIDIHLDYIESAILGLPSQGGPYYIIVDGLDECTHGTGQKLMECLQNLIKNAASTLLVFLTGRQDLPSRLRHRGESKYSISMHDGKDELQSYITGELRRRLEQEEDFQVNLASSSNVSEILVARSKGMFLWAAFQIEALSEAVTEAEVSEILASLPEDLPQTYDRVIRKLHRAKKIDLRKKLFRFISAAKRPLTIDELAEAASVVLRKAELEPAHMITDMRKALLHGGGSLLDVDEERLTVHFAHPSIQQHLAHSLGSDLQEYLTTEETADLSLGEVCITYLGFSKYEGQLLRKEEPKNDNAFKLAARDVPLMIGQDSKTTKLAVTLLRMRKGVSQDRKANVGAQFAQVHVVPRELEPEVEGDAFLSYAKEYWMHHTRFLEAYERPPVTADYHKREPYHIWFNLLHHELPIAQTPWGPRRFEDRGPETISWVLENSHHALFRQLLQMPLKSVDADSAPLISALDAHRDSPLIRDDVLGLILVAAAHAQNEEMVKYMIEEKRTPVDADGYGGFRTALQAASFKSHISIMTYLIFRGADVNAPPGDLGQALTAAAWASGSDPSLAEAAVRLLLAHGANVHAVSGDNHTALTASIDVQNKLVQTLLLDHFHGSDLDEAIVTAAVANDIDVIPRLVHRGGKVNVETKNYFRTALIGACLCEHEAAVNVLFKCGANANMISGDLDAGYCSTALTKAAERGLENMIKLLAHHGAQIDLDVPSLQGNALAHAAYSGRYEACKLLLQLGANPNAHTGRKGSALNVAIDESQTAIVKLMLRHGADPRRQHPSGSGISHAKKMLNNEIDEMFLPYTNND